MCRFKWVIGDLLRYRIDQCRETKVAIAVDELNRMLEHGHPIYVRPPVTVSQNGGATVAYQLMQYSRYKLEFNVRLLA